MSVHENDRIRWCRLATSGRWHAFRVDEGRSVCARMYADATTEAGEHGAARRLCLTCQRKLGMRTPPSGRLASTRRQPEEMVAEFMGGPWDGMRIPLIVVRRGATRMTVLRHDYRTHLTSMFKDDAMGRTEERVGMS